jgi:hypothetical protein
VSNPTALTGRGEKTAAFLAILSRLPQQNVTHDRERQQPLGTLKPILSTDLVD